MGGIDPFAPFARTAPERTAEQIAELHRRMSASERRSFDPFNWGLGDNFRPLWHTVGNTGEPAFGTGWANLGAGYEEVGFWRDPFGFVHLRGMAQAGGGGAIATLFILPAGYRPDNILTMPGAGSAAGDVAVLPTGEVDSLGTTSAGSTLSISGLQFYAES